MGEEQAKRRRGRPSSPDSAQRTERLTLGIRPEIKSALEDRASRSGRSLSAEAEYWLGRALLTEGILDQALDLRLGVPASGLALLLIGLIGEVGDHAGFKSGHTLDAARNWLSNPYAYQQVEQAIAAVLGALRPDGEIVMPPGGKVGDLDLDYANLHFGEGTAVTWLKATLGEMLGKDYESWGQRIRDRLGPAVVERIRQSRDAADEGDADG
jgi:hypothetical protein